MNRSSRVAPTSPSRGNLYQHLNPFYFDFTKNHCNCCPHDDPLLILFQYSNCSLKGSSGGYNLKRKKSSIEEYKKLIDEAILQYERLEIESALRLLKQATSSFSKEDEYHHFLAPLLHAQILGDTIHDETIRNEMIIPCRDRLEQALEYIEMARENYKQMKRIRLSLHSNNSSNNNGTIHHDEKKEERLYFPQKGQHLQSLESLLKRIEFWIDSIEHYVMGNFEEMKKSSSKGISLGEEIYSKLNCSHHHPWANRTLQQQNSHYYQQHIFQHNFEKDINYIYQHYRDASMGELWRLQFIASNCQQGSSPIPPDHLRMQYRYLCKSMAYGNLVPSRVLCQIALVCYSLERYSNAPNSVSNFQIKNCNSSSDEELMLRAKIHDLVFHESGHTLGEKINLAGLRTLKEANLFSKTRSPRENVPSLRRTTLPEQYFQDSFLLNGRGSFCGSIQCSLVDTSLITQNISKVVRLFPVEGKFNPVLLSITGYCLYKDGEDKRSDNHYSKAMFLHPNNFSIYKSMNEKFFLLCYRFFLLTEEKFVEQAEVLFNRILNLALKRSTSDRLIQLVRGQQRCFLSLIPTYYDNSIDIELREDEIQRTLESLDYYSFLSTEEQIQGLVCKYTKRMRENLFRFSSNSLPSFTDLTCNHST